MSVSQELPNLPKSLPRSPKKKRVLLVDASAIKRDLHADVMRNLGIEVDCAADISEARSWWRADLYNLVLIRGGSGLVNCEKFCQDVRTADPPQRLGFLVGKPDYIADAPGVTEAEFVEQASSSDCAGNATMVESSGAKSQRWGIMEASRRISRVRSAAHTRARAIRERPAPPRDSELRGADTITSPRTLDDLLKEETQ